MQYRLNLKTYFQKIGADFARELGLNIRNQKDIDGKSFQPVKSSTARARQSVIGANSKSVSLHKGKGIVPATGKQRKAPATSVPITRLFFTGDFWQNAFKFQAKDESATVFVSEGNHKNSEASYADIVRYNNRGSDEINTHISNPPLVFPMNQDDVRKMKAWKNLESMLPEMSRDIARQVKSQMVRRNVSINL